jgi:hypothetical protein
LIASIVLQNIIFPMSWVSPVTGYAYVVGEADLTGRPGFVIRNAPISSCSNYQLQPLGDIAEKRAKLRDDRQK